MRITDATNNYVKPKVTVQDMISKDMEMFKDKLDGFIQIHSDNYEDIDTGIWLKYITSDNKYRSGGILINNKFPQYFVLKNPYNNLSWCADLTKNIFFMKNISILKEKMIEKNNLYELYKAGLVKILEEPEN